MAWICIVQPLGMILICREIQTPFSSIWSDFKHHSTRSLAYTAAFCLWNTDSLTRNLRSTEWALSCWAMQLLYWHVCYASSISEICACPSIFSKSDRYYHWIWLLVCIVDSEQSSQHLISHPGAMRQVGSATLIDFCKKNLLLPSSICNAGLDTCNKRKIDAICKKGYKIDQMFEQFQQVKKARMQIYFSCIRAKDFAEMAAKAKLTIRDTELPLQDSINGTEGFVWDKRLEKAQADRCVQRFSSKQVLVPQITLHKS